MYYELIERMIPLDHPPGISETVLTMKWFTRKNL